MNKIDMIKCLVIELNKASDFYYNTDKVIMSDKLFDLKFDELKKLEEETGIVMSNSVTQKVGFEVKTKLEKVSHSIPLKSLGKTKSVNEIKSFIGNHEVLGMLKGDGLTCELIYDKGIFQQGSTRGNSFIGENITHNVKTFKGIPLTIEFKGYLKLAGESVIFDDDFVTINNKLKDEDKYSHSRNLVAGSVRQLNSKICANRSVNFMAFSLLECEVKGFTTIEEQFKFLDNLGFNIIPYTKIDLNNDKLEETVDKLKQMSVEKGVPIDGIVFAFSNLKYSNSLGETAHHPLGKIALKFSDDEYETKYIKTEWQVSRTSVINPVGTFEPIDLDGAITTRATLHNIDYFEALELGENNIIIVARQNQVIPKILNNLTRSNTEKIPSQCPICGEKTEIRLQKTARFLYCTNDNCPSKKVAQFEHFCSRDAMNIMNVSTAILETFIDKGYIKNISDIYKLEQYKREIMKLEGFGRKSYDRILEGINNSKSAKLENFIYALGISQIGKGGSKIISKYCNGDIDKFMTMITSKFNFAKLEDIGEITNDAINEFFNNIDNKNMVNDLLEYIKIEKEEIKMANSSVDLTAKIFVVTGGVHIYKNRDSIKEKISLLGGKTSGSVSKKTTYLICNEPSETGKYRAATDLNIPILTEEAFQEMIGE
jgi:DNA ligase (NAD+)